ncbi:TrbI/VirB10 family protein [Sphingomonas sp. DT-204]|uniref:TrbI/VirB10 family protein n=1 Tax=Sphingomonas sp. DT-204 TaxID=3396166 RepID=UPI003F1C3280
MSTSVDPRSAIPPSAEPDILPVVARPRSGLSTPMIVLIAVIAGLLLFGVLEARRRALTAPAVMPRSAELTASNAPPPLYIPPEPSAAMSFPARPAPPPAVPEPRKPATSPAPRYDASGPALAIPEGTVPYEPPAIRTAPAAALPADVAAGASLDSSDPKIGAGTSADGAERVRASMLANRSTTVPQGTLIPVVLETAFDSTRAGFARGLVQRDVRGFDGSRVLIPRGSRLIGEYKSDAAPGQKRALINWTRLIRPDGASIAIGSPAVDTVGRGGVRAKVNSHFFERFTGMILQSALDLGVTLAARSADAPVFVALPGQLNGAAATVQPTQIPPTLKIAPGTSISVFVARDLDFTVVETGRAGP